MMHIFSGAERLTDMIGEPRHVAYVMAILSSLLALIDLRDLVRFSADAAK